jgi:hypothetical protein
MLYWVDFNAMHEVLDKFSGYFKALILELIDKPMDRAEIWESVTKLVSRLGKRRRSKTDMSSPNKDLEYALQRGVLKEKDARFLLTPKGREIAEHMMKVIPRFMGGLFSKKTVTFVAACSILVWLGATFDKEKAVSVFIIVMMFVSVLGLAGFPCAADLRAVKDRDISPCQFHVRLSMDFSPLPKRRDPWR